MFMALAFSVGCSDDFLERPPKNSLIDATYYQTDEQVLAGTAFLYSRVWFDYNDQASFALGDFRGGTAFSAWNNRDNVEFNTTANTAANGNAWRAFFNVVGQSNTMLKNIQQFAGPEVTPRIKNQALGESRFMRGMAYQYLVMNWGPVPIIEDNTQYLNGESVYRNTEASVWRFITKDLRAAAELLPETPVQPGRVTRWSAEAGLARAYLTRAGVSETGESTGSKNQVFLDSAMYYAQRVINAPGYDLLEDYADLFKVDYANGISYDNNPESLFSLQWVHPGGWGSQNSTPAYLTYNAEIANGDGWGGDVGATEWMLNLYEGMEDNGYTQDERLKATFMLPGFRYPEVMRATTVNGEPATIPLVYPFSGTDQNYAAVKKYITGKTTPENAAQQSYGHDTYMIRLAEMYLIYAEAALGNSMSTSDPQAIEYFNAVHTRAGLQPVSGSITFREIFNERIKEFAMEAMAWYDLVRLWYWNPQMAYDIINEQDRGLFFIEPDQMPNPTSWEFTDTEWYEFNNANASGANFRLPIPATEMSSMPSLGEAAVDYYAE